MMDKNASKRCCPVLFLGFSRHSDQYSIAFWIGIPFRILEAFLDNLWKEIWWQSRWTPFSSGTLLQEFQSEKQPTLFNATW